MFQSIKDVAWFPHVTELEASWTRTGKQNLLQEHKYIDAFDGKSKKE